MVLRKGYVAPQAVGNIPDPNAGAGTEQNNGVDVKVSGAVNIYIGDTMSQTGELYWMGQQIDDTAIVTREFFNDVPADSHGGPQGPPIDRQVLGRIVQLSFNLSTWSQRTRTWIEQQNYYSVPGAIYDWEVGEPLFQTHGFRIVLVPARDNRITAAQPATKSQDWFCYNFPMCVMAGPIEASQSTKFTTLSFTMEAHRVPQISNTLSGVIWNRDVTGVDQAVAARQEEMQAQYDAILAERAKTAPVPEE